MGPGAHTFFPRSLAFVGSFGPHILPRLFREMHVLPCTRPVRGPDHWRHGSRSERLGGLVPLPLQQAPAATAVRITVPTAARPAGARNYGAALSAITHSEGWGGRDAGASPAGCASRRDHDAASRRGSARPRPAVSFPHPTGARRFGEGAGAAAR